MFVGIVSPYLLSHEVGGLYERRGQAKPVSAATGLWVFPGIFLVVGPTTRSSRAEDPEHLRAGAR
jgi:hypothetical protein